MSAKLEQLLGYLDRADVSEIIVGVGRPITVKMSQGYTPLTSLPVSEPQFQALVGGTPLDRVMKTAGSAPVDCDLGKRRIRVELLRRTDGNALRIQHAPAATAQPKTYETTIAMPRVAAARPASEPQPTLELEPEPEPEPVRVAPAARPDPAPPVETNLPEPEPDPDPDTVFDDGIFDERIDTTGIAAYVRAARQAGASDLHIAANRPVQVRVMGDLRPLDARGDAIASDIVDRILLPLLGPRRRVQLRTKGYVDFAFDVKDGGRLRGNISRQQGGLRAAFRLARVTPPTLDELNLPRELAKVVAHHQGLVVIAGPNGQGKTTTMAALVDLVNSTKAHHIITIEDPVELEHPRKQSVISQREVGRHTRSFAAALKASLREDPDVIVIGELRDRETVEIALTAAETGHLVLATMSTPSAAKTIDRLIDMFPPADQQQARASIAGALRAIVAQRLLPSRAHGVVPAVEVVTGVLPLAVLIRDDKLYQLPNLMQRGRAFGMIRFEDSVLELLRAGKITEETMRQYSPGAAAQLKTQAQMQTQPMGRVGRRGVERDP